MQAIRGIAFAVNPTHSQSTIMNKVFLAVLVFGFAIAATAPSNEKAANPSQFEVNKESVENMVNANMDISDKEAVVAILEIMKEFYSNNPVDVVDGVKKSDETKNCCWCPLLNMCMEQCCGCIFWDCGDDIHNG